MPLSRYLRGDFIVIGAGPAGLACALRLAQLSTTGHFGGNVRLLEKEPEAGGRASCSLTKHHYFDYGFQRFATPSVGTSWHRVVGDLRQEWKCSEWGNVEKDFDSTTNTITEIINDDEYYTLVPSVKVLSKFLWASYSRMEDLITSAPVTRIQRWERGQWILQTSGKKWYRADAIIVAAPPPVVLPLFSGDEEHPLPESSLIEPASMMKYKPVIVLLLGWDSPGYSICDVLNIKNHPVIAHIYDNGSKEARPKDRTCLTIVCTPEFSEEHCSVPEKQLTYYLADQLSTLEIMSEVPPPKFAACHIWKLGYHISTEKHDPMWDPDAGLGFVGDWTLGANTLEAAWNSGVRLANTIVGETDLDKIEPIRYSTFNANVVKAPEPSDAKIEATLYGKSRSNRC